MWRRVFPLWCWAELVWTLLTFTASVEQIVVGAVVSLVVAVACAPLGSVAGPWALLRPSRLWPLVALLVVSAGRIIVANVKLSRRIWHPALIKSGMVVTRTGAKSDAELTSVGLLTSLIVNSQLVDLDRRRAELQYHTVDVTEASDRTINRPIEDRVLAVTRQ